MSGYLIGEVCRLLDVKPHILRYWEQQVPLLTPRKDHAGRRIYSPREVQILFRLRYLIVTRRLTTEGAARKILEEVQGPGADLKARVHELRESLLGLQRDIRTRTAAGEVLLLPPSGHESVAALDQIWAQLPVSRRAAVASDLARWSGDVARYAALPAPRCGHDASGARDGSGERDARTIRVYRWRRPELQHYFPESGGRLRVAVVILGDGSARLRTTIARIAADLADASRYGVVINAWLIVASPGELGDPAALLRFCSARSDIAAPVNVMTAHPFPLRDEHNRFVVDAQGPGLAGCSEPLLWAVREVAHQESLASVCDALVVCDHTTTCEGPGPVELLAWFDPRRCDAVAAAVRDPGAALARGYRRAGPAVVSVSLVRSAANQGVGSLIRQRRRVFRQSVDPDDIHTEELYRGSLSVVDLLAAARRPRVFSTGKTEWNRERNPQPG